MRSILVTGVLVATAVSGPVLQRFTIQSEDESMVGASDVSILTYALVLEHLENAFYRGGLQNFTRVQFAAAGFDAAFYANLEQVAQDEANHVAFLTAGLTAASATPPAECLYDFLYTSPTSFVALASILEGVDVSAYLGTAADITSKDYMTEAGSILTIKARYSSYLRASLGEPAFPSSYDAPLDFDQVDSLASQFFVSCPSTNPKLGVTAFPRLSSTATVPVKSGQAITLSTPNCILTDSNGSTSGQLYGASMTPTGLLFVPATAVPGGYSVVIPANVSGQTYVILTACNERVNDETTAAGPAIIEVEN